MKSPGNIPVVIFSNMRSDAPIEATSLFIGRALAEHRTVYFIENPFTFKDYISNKKSADAAVRTRSLFRQDELFPDSKNPKLKRMIMPFVFPVNFLPEGKLYRTALKLNEAIIARRIKKILKKEGVTDFVFINSFNIYYPGVGKALKPTLNIYQCLDPVITTYDLRHGEVSELELVKQSDFVICTSKALYLKQAAINKNSYLIPNAVDLSPITAAIEGNLPVYEKVKDVPKPVVGYLGSIEHRMNFALMAQVIQNNPDKSFVFAGPIVNEHVPEGFFDKANVYVLGRVPYTETPRLLKGFDIAIIPFKKEDLSDTVFPLKLFEYMGAGLPVVVTDFNNDLKDYTHNAVAFCSNAATFTAALNDIVANDDVGKSRERIAIARQNTWEIRTKELEKLIEKYMAAKAEK